MADDEGDYQEGQEQMENDGGATDDFVDGFDNYEETTVDPGSWLLTTTALFCFGVMLLVVPYLVLQKVRQRAGKNQEEKSPADWALMNDGKPEVDTNLMNVVRFDKETRKILKLAVPFTITGLTGSVFSNICLALISFHVGTKAVAAYAVSQILLGLVDGALHGPIYACTTLCAQAVGAGNSYLAGQYIQIATSLYILCYIPVVWFWWNYTYAIILFLEWGDEAIAQLAQDFARIYVWSYLLSGASSGLWHLLEVTGHTAEETVISMIWSFLNVVVIWALVVFFHDSNLQHVAWAYIGMSLLFVIGTYSLAEHRGWLKPFRKGLFENFALSNSTAVKALLTQAVPLAFGSLLANAEWAILTFFASALGPAEVAAWAILGSIWEVFYSVTGGIGDAAEIRCALHLGDNNPTMARLSAYKSLFFGMALATIVSIFYFCLQDRLPTWFTPDETLQKMLAEVVPYVGIGNLTMTFGMQCWSIIGSQGKYKLATWISFFSSWGICMPMSAFFVYVCRYDLQGLTAAVVIGYVSTGAALSYVLLSTNWKKIAQTISDQNSGKSGGDAQGAAGAENGLYAALRPNSAAARARARRNIRLLSLQPGLRSGIVLGNIHQRRGTYVLCVRDWSPLHGHVKCGDSILALDGQDVTKSGAHEISALIASNNRNERELVIAADGRDEDDRPQDDDDFFFEAIAEDETKDYEEKDHGGSTLQDPFENYTQASIPINPDTNLQDSVGSLPQATIKIGPDTNLQDPLKSYIQATID